MCGQALGKKRAKYFDIFFFFFPCIKFELHSVLLTGRFSPFISIFEEFLIVVVCHWFLLDLLRLFHPSYFKCSFFVIFILFGIQFLREKNSNLTLGKCNNRKTKAKQINLIIFFVFFLILCVVQISMYSIFMCFKFFDFSCGKKCSEFCVVVRMEKN